MELMKTEDSPNSKKLYTDQDRKCNYPPASTTTCKNKEAKIMRNYNVKINFNKSCILAGKTKKELCSIKKPTESYELKC